MTHKREKKEQEIRWGQKKLADEVKRQLAEDLKHWSVYPKDAVRVEMGLPCSVEPEDPVVKEMKDILLPEGESNEYKAGGPIRGRSVISAGYVSVGAGGGGGGSGQSYAHLATEINQLRAEVAQLSRQMTILMTELTKFKKRSA